jgi:hypothetical protein
MATTTAYRRCSRPPDHAATAQVQQVSSTTEKDARLRKPSGSDHRLRDRRTTRLASGEFQVHAVDLELTCFGRGARL